jgi:hypothetical protein
MDYRRQVHRMRAGHRVHRATAAAIQVHCLMYPETPRWCKLRKQSCEAAAVVAGWPTFLLLFRHPAAAATVHLVRVAATPSAAKPRLQHTHHFDVVTAPDRAPLHRVRLARNLISAQSAPQPVLCVLECSL